MEELEKNIYENEEIQYCEVCGEALERMYPPSSIMASRKHARKCKCERERIQRENAERKKDEHIRLVERNKSICFDENGMYEWRFDCDDGDNEQMEVAKKYVKEWSSMKKNNVGLLLWGGVGSGKSFMAGCIANALLDEEITVKMTNFATISNDLFSYEDKNEYISWLCGFGLLIIDDLGAERHTEYTLESIFNVIDRRVRSKKPLIVTTNLSIGELKNAKTDAERRIYDRILECCVPVCVDAKSRRAVIGEKKIKMLREIMIRGNLGEQNKG